MASHQLHLANTLTDTLALKQHVDYSNVLGLIQLKTIEYRICGIFSEYPKILTVQHVGLILDNGRFELLSYCIPPTINSHGSFHVLDTRYGHKICNCIVYIT